VVEENNLTQSISTLRKALGEKRQSPQYILTIPGVGYRFIGRLNQGDASALSVPSDRTEDLAAASITRPEIRAASVSSGADPVRDRRRLFTIIALAVVVLFASGYFWLAHRARVKAAAASAQIHSIAVLPFKALGDASTDQFIGVGMTDALITKLSSIHQITVRPTSSVVKYQGADVDPSAAGRELEVDSVLDGRLQRSGDRIRLTVQLLRASDGAPLWGDTFDEKYTDIFAVEDRVSESVMRALLPTLTELQKQQLNKHYTENTEAFQSYTKGRYYWNQRTAADLRRAISFFEDAIIQDPNFALAYAGLADSYATLGVLDNVDPQNTMPKARSAAMKALELDDGLAEAHASLGYVKHRFEFDFAGAEHEFQRALELNPQYPTAHQWYGWYLISTGRTDEANAHFQRAQQLDPRSLYTNLTLGAPYFYSGQYGRAEEQFKQVLQLNPDFPLGHWWLFLTYMEEKRFDEALAQLQINAGKRNESVDVYPIVGYFYAVSGKPDQARRELERLLHPANDDYIPPSTVASIYAALGEKEQAFDWLVRALKAHDTSLVFLRVDPRYTNLHSDPRFAEFVKRAGLPE
jgi:TolB-like protein